MQIYNSPQFQGQLTATKTKALTQQQQVLPVKQNKTTETAPVKSEKVFSQDQQDSALLARNQVNQEKAKFTDYDQPSEQNHTAVATYQHIDNLAQRENIQEVFGVDLFA